MLLYVSNTRLMIRKAFHRCFISYCWWINWEASLPPLWAYIYKRGRRSSRWSVLVGDLNHHLSEAPRVRSLIRDVRYILWGTRVLKLLPLDILGGIPGYHSSVYPTKNNTYSRIPGCQNLLVLNTLGYVPGYQNLLALGIIGYVPGYHSSIYPSINSAYSGVPGYQNLLVLDILGCVPRYHSSTSPILSRGHSLGYPGIKNVAAVHTRVCTRVSIEYVP